MAIQEANGVHLPAKQKAAQFDPKTKSVSINEIPVPSIGPSEVLIKVKAASICHSDLMLWESNEAGLAINDAKPFTMGHEGCGTILQLGSDVTGFTKGDLVGWLPVANVCFDCEGCQVHYLKCENGSPTTQGFSADGNFQEYVAVHYRNVARVPDDMDLTSLAPLFCAGSTAYNSVVDTIKELEGEPADTYIAVVGCGGLGHMGIQFLKAYGYNVIGIDISDATLEGAKSCGADHVFNSQTQSDYVEQVRKIAGGKGCHAAINYTNSVPAYLATPPLLRAWGVLMVTGIPQQPIPFHAMDLAMGGMRVRGSNNGTTPRLLKCVEFAHKHGIKPHVTNYKLEQFQEMVETMQANKHQGRRLGVVFE